MLSVDEVKAARKLLSPLLPLTCGAACRVAGCSTPCLQIGGMGAELEQREVETRLEHLVAPGGEVSLYCLYILIPEQMGRNVTFVYGIGMIHHGGEFRGAKTPL